MGHVGDELCRQGLVIVVDVGVVGQYPRSRHRESVIFGHGVGIGVGDGWVVDGVDGEGKGLGRRGIYPAMGRAAIVLQGDGDDGLAMEIQGRFEGQVAAGGAHRGLRGKEGVVVVADQEGEALTRFVGRTGRDGRGPAEDGLGSGVLVHGDVGPGDKARRVVDGLDGQSHQSLYRGRQLVVECLVLERIGPKVVGSGRVGEGAIGAQVQGAVGDVGDELRRQGLVIVVNVGVVGQHAWGSHGEDAVFGHGVCVAAGDGRVVDGSDGDGDHCCVGLGREAIVAGLVLEYILPRVVGVGCVGERAIGIQAQVTMLDIGDEVGLQVVVLHVGVVGQYPRSRHVERVIFGHGIGIAVGDGCVVDGSDGNGKRDRRRGVDAAMGGAAVVLQCGGDDGYAREIWGRLERQGTGGRVHAGLDGKEGVVVVGDQEGEGLLFIRRTHRDGCGPTQFLQWGIFVDNHIRTAVKARRVVDRKDGDRDSGCVARAVVIADLIVEGIDAVPVCVWGVGDQARGGHDSQDPVAWHSGHQGREIERTIRVAVVGQHIDDHRMVFQGAGRIVVGQRRKVDVQAGAGLVVGQVRIVRIGVQAVGLVDEGLPAGAGIHGGIKGQGGLAFRRQVPNRPQTAVVRARDWVGAAEGEAGGQAVRKGRVLCVAGAGIGHHEGERNRVAFVGFRVIHRFGYPQVGLGRDRVRDRHLVVAGAPVDQILRRSYHHSVGHILCGRGCQIPGDGVGDRFASGNVHCVTNTTSAADDTGRVGQGRAGPLGTANDQWNFIFHSGADGIARPQIGDDDGVGQVQAGHQRVGCYRLADSEVGPRGVGDINVAIGDKGNDGAVGA